MKSFAIVPALAGLIVAACGRDTPRPADARESTSDVAVPASGAVPPEPGVSAPVEVTGPVSFERAESSFTARRYDEAVALFTTYTSEQPENPWGFYMLGLAAWKSGDRVSAEEALRQAIALDSTHVKSRLNLSRVLIDDGRSDEALKELEQVVVIDSTLGETARLLGRAHAARGETDLAMNDYRRAIVLDGTDVWAMNNLGVLLIEQGRHSEALGPLARASEIRPGSPVFQNNLGSALEGSGYITAAGQAYGAALAADSGYTKARVSLERVSGLTDSPSPGAIDLSEVAREFVRTIERWRQEVRQPES